MRQKYDNNDKKRQKDNDKMAKWQKNIAIGTTDPDIDSVTWIKFINNITPIALVANLVIRWCHLHKLQIWPPYGATCISSKFGHHQ